MTTLNSYLAPLDWRARKHREANEAARQQGFVDELQHWIAEAKKAAPGSDRWHECMDELDVVKTLLRKS